MQEFALGMLPRFKSVKMKLPSLALHRRIVSTVGNFMILGCTISDYYYSNVWHQTPKYNYNNLVRLTTIAELCDWFLHSQTEGGQV